MTIATLSTWHELVASRNARGLNALLADNVVFHSPVVHTPQVGKAITTQYLSAALHVFFNESFNREDVPRQAGSRLSSQTLARGQRDRDAWKRPQHLAVHGHKLGAQFHCQRDKLAVIC